MPEILHKTLSFGSGNDLLLMQSPYRAMIIINLWVLVGKKTLRTGLDEREEVSIAYGR